MQVNNEGEHEYIVFIVIFLRKALRGISKMRKMGGSYFPRVYLIVMDLLRLQRLYYLLNQYQ